MTANGLGSPLVIKHMRQEEEKPAQHDQWYWSMVSGIVIGNGAGTLGSLAGTDAGEWHWYWYWAAGAA